MAIYTLTYTDLLKKSRQNYTNLLAISTQNVTDVLTLSTQNFRDLLAISTQNYTNLLAYLHRTKQIYWPYLHRTTHIYWPYLHRTTQIYWPNIHRTTPIYWPYLHRITHILTLPPSIVTVIGTFFLMFFYLLGLLCASWNIGYTPIKHFRHDLSPPNLFSKSFGHWEYKAYIKWGVNRKFIYWLPWALKTICRQKNYFALQACTTKGRVQLKFLEVFTTKAWPPPPVRP